MNIFTIHNLQVSSESGPTYHYFNAEVHCTLTVYCTDHGNSLIIYRVNAVAKSKDVNDSLRKAIEHLINFDDYCDISKNVQAARCFCGCGNYRRDPVAIQIHVGEPYKSVFEQLFKATSWSFPKELTR